VCVCVCRERTEQQLLHSQIIVGSSKFVGVCLVFMFATANGMNFEIPSEMKPVRAHSCGTGNRSKFM